MTLVTANNRYLVTDNQPFFALGVNYHGHNDRVWQLWSADKFDSGLIEQDFVKAKHLGFNLIRLFLDNNITVEINQGNFEPLDQLIGLAETHQLKLILTLNATHSLNLTQVGRVSAVIADRYQNSGTIAAYDLENEPAFYHLGAASYPEPYLPPIQTSVLIDHYGSRVSREETADLQRRRYIPDHLNEEQSFHYINGLHLFREFNTALKQFVQAGRGSEFDFITSDDASPWYPLITVLDETLQNWLQARIDPIRETGAQQLLTVGWNLLPLAILPANRALGIQSYHQIATLNLMGFRQTTSHLKSLRRAFPDHPILLTEFGWSNRTPTNHPVDPSLTALHEGALFSYLRANEFAGGCKWMLNDAATNEETNADTPEANYGVFQADHQPKPVAELVHQFAEQWPAVEHKALYFSAVRDLGSTMAYRFDLPEQITVGGHTYQDNAVSWQASGLAGHCIITRGLDQITVEAVGSGGQLSIEPWLLCAGWNREHETSVYRVYGDHQKTWQQSWPAGQSVTVDVLPGAQYLVAMSQATPAPAVETATPLTGEHVLVLGSASQDLPDALGYIRRFGPDVTFAPADVAGKWAYVTVVASPEAVSDAELDNIRGYGTLIVERINGANRQQQLDQMAQRGQRFLSSPASAVGLVDLAPPTNPEENYIIKPGDTLHTIAETLYGNSELWSVLWEANQDIITEPQQLRVGLMLRVPELM